VSTITTGWSFANACPIAGENDVEIAASSVDGIVVMEPRGRVNSQTAPLLGERLTEALSAPGTRLALDLSGVEYLSSAGLRVLQMAAMKAGQNSGKLVLHGLNSRVAEVFEISGFAEILSVFATREEALAAARS
jgi:anti-anti-sigma factor